MTATTATTPTPICLPVLDAHGRNFVLFATRKYAGMAVMFSQLVINNVDKDAKKAAAAVFVDGLATVLKEESITLMRTADIRHKALHPAFRAVIIRPDDALDTSLEGVTAWYMLDERSFATEEASMRMSTDRSGLRCPVGGADRASLCDKLAAVKQALTAGNADALRVLWKDASVEEKRELFDEGVEAAAQLALEQGKTQLVLLLLHTFDLSKRDVCGHDNYAFRRAILAGHFGVVEVLRQAFCLTRDDFFGPNFCVAHEAVRAGNLTALKYLLGTFPKHITAKDVCGRKYSVFCEAVLQGHTDMIQFLVRHFDMCKGAQ